MELSARAIIRRPVKSSIGPPRTIRKTPSFTYNLACAMKRQGDFAAAEANVPASASRPILRISRRITGWPS